MIYLDHNASNIPAPELVAAYSRGLEEGWANPSSPHAPGRRARALIEEAREQVAGLLGVTPGQVTFTASGTEALNQAILSVGATQLRPAKVVASAVEHPAVLEPLERLASGGRLKPRLAAVDSQGRVELSDLAALVAEGAQLVAVMAAQNEVGTVQPLEEVGRVCAEEGTPLLVDASQALGRLVRDWSAIPWDYLVVSAHKLRAPRGAAALVHRGLAPEPLPILLGGPQELGRRAGTEAVAAIYALGEACRLVGAGSLCDPAQLAALRDRFEALLKERIPGLEILGEEAERLPQTSLLLLPGADSEALLAGLDLAGVAASSGSACSSGALKPSHVLAAMGVPPARARGRLRLSYGPETGWDELEQTVETLVGLL